MDKHEAAAAEVAGARQGHRKREADRHRRVDRVAAEPQDVEADLRGRCLLGHNHAVLRDNGQRGGEGRQDPRRIRTRAGRGEQQESEGG